MTLTSRASGAVAQGVERGELDVDARVLGLAVGGEVILVRRWVHPFAIVHAKQRGERARRLRRPRLAQARPSSACTSHSSTIPLPPKFLFSPIEPRWSITTVVRGKRPHMAPMFPRSCGCAMQQTACRVSAATAHIRSTPAEPSQDASPFSQARSMRKPVTPCPSIDRIAAWEKHVLSARGFKRVGRHSEYAL